MYFSFHSEKLKLLVILNRFSGVWSGRILAFIAGTTNALSFLPYNLHLVPFLTVAIISLLVLYSKSLHQVTILGFLYGLGWFGIGISWIHISISNFGEMPLVFSLAVMLIFVGYLAIFPAITLYLAWRLTKDITYFPMLMVANWTLIEFIRSWLLSGFPWISLGYSQTNGWLSSYAPLIGETGITAIIIFIGSLSAVVVSRSINRAVMLQVLFSICLLSFVKSPIAEILNGWAYSNKVQPVALVQGNIEQELKWNTFRQDKIMRKYLVMSLPYLDGRIVIWPETAIPKLEVLAQEYISKVNSLSLENGSSIISGVIDQRLDGSVYNSMIVMGSSSSLPSESGYYYRSDNRYQKHQLVPIGEFVPFDNLIRRLDKIFNLPYSSINRGERIQGNLVANGVGVLPSICYEVAFPRQMRLNFNSGSQLIVTISNDAWFGDSIGPFQHFQIAVMRAMEFGRPLLRAANTGITAVVGPDGKVLGRLPQFKEGVLSMDVPLVEGKTPYSIYGDWPIYIISFFVFMLHVRKFD